MRPAGPRGHRGLRDPKTPRPRSAPTPGSVPLRLLVPLCSRRTRTGQARDSGSREGGRAARGGPEVGGGVLYRRPAPRRPAPSEAWARPRAALSRNNLLETAGRSPPQSAGSPGDPACAGCRQVRGPAPRMGPRPLPYAPQPPALTPASGRASGTQLLR